MVFIIRGLTIIHFRWTDKEPAIEFCEQPLKTRLESCVRFYQKLKLKKVETEYKIVRDANIVSEKCENQTMTFWRPGNSSTVSGGRTNVTLDVPMFTCPLTKMDLKFIDGDIDAELEDVYVTKGTKILEFAILRNSVSSSNICLTNLFRVKLRKKLDDEFLRNAKQWNFAVDNVKN